ncbi:ATP-binding cassette domain-containing protein [Actinomadura sp. B10D3]|uniref:ABC transporter permease subunit n=1 Tax=Actinomadura sp. B10D3 TaxID=3153557 RepID=UPI00325F1C22
MIVQALSRLRGRPVVAIAAVFTIAVTATMNSGYYLVQLLSVACLYAVLAISLDLCWGYAGILSLGHAVFFGIGDYSVAYFGTALGRGGQVVPDPSVPSMLLGLVAGLVIAGAVALLVGLLAFSGPSSDPLFPSVVTLALTVIGYTVALALGRLGKDSGLFGYQLWPERSTAWYVGLALLLLVVLVAARTLVRSDFGLLMKAIRDNELRCKFLGFPTSRVKLAVFVGSALLAALAGGAYGAYQGVVSPPMLNFLFATEILIWVAVGGRGTLYGPLLGAVVLNLLGARLSADFPFGWLLVMGALLVLVVTVVPDGLYPAVVSGVRWLVGPRRSVRSKSSERDLAPAAPLDTDEPVSLPGTTVVDVSGVRRNFGALQVLKGIDLTVRAGEILCLVGPNGAGKTTLLGVLSDGTAEFSGQIVLRLPQRTELTGRSPAQLARLGIGRKFQAPNLFDGLTVAETMCLAARRGRVPSLWRRSRRIEVDPEALRVLAASGLTERLDAEVSTLTHGLKQALELAAAVALRPKLVLLDEPTAGLTVEERAVVGELLRDLVAAGLTVVLVEHDFAFVRGIADRMAVLHDGQTTVVGPVAEVADSPLVREIYLGVAQ